MIVSVSTNPVDAESVPSKYFGVILSPRDWNILAERLNRKEVKYLIKPYICFEGLPREQSTFFIEDPSGNALEFKSFSRDESIFSTHF